MAREWLLRGVDPEELKREEKPEIPETPRSKWQNFWYHHKWTFWGCTFAAVVLVVMVGQMFFRNTPDYQVLLMTETAYIDSDVQVMENLLAQYGEDLDGDGKVEVNVQNCLMGDTVHQQYNSGYQLISAHLMAADVMVFVWDEDSYDRFSDSLSNVTVKDGDFLTDLPVESDQLSEDKKLWYWNKNDDRYITFKELLPDYENFPQNFIFGVRNTTGTAKNATTMHQQGLELIQRFIEDNKTTEKTEEGKKSTTSATEAVETTTQGSSASTTKATTVKNETTSTTAKTTSTTKKTTAATTKKTTKATTKQTTKTTKATEDLPYIDPRVKIGKSPVSNTPTYSLNKCYVLDTRTWGERPSIEVYNDNSLKVTYYNKKGEKVTFNVEHPGDELINQFVILDDGTYVSQYIGAFS